MFISSGMMEKYTHIYLERLIVTNQLYLMYYKDSVINWDVTGLKKLWLHVINYDFFLFVSILDKHMYFTLLILVPSYFIIYIINILNHMILIQMMINLSKSTTKLMKISIKNLIKTLQKMQIKILITIWN